ncbi:hypothetical protein M9H77_36501 [Catharanthus roseus]|uniref:Uncharacterized protein n=1 Tax=Catharanthus roseus TaxID=4058 RepID=A0ACB9ZRY6_CATRO|nr:hypothetical protein M9H77_36501 [Catharanthus roseus]
MEPAGHWQQRPTVDGRPHATFLYIQLVSKVSRFLQFIFLDSRIEDFDSRFQSFNLATKETTLDDVRDFNCDYSPGCLEFKNEGQSRANNWGLIGAID